MNFLNALGKYLIVIAPYLLLGLIMAGVIHIFLNMDKLKSLINRGKIGDIFRAALLGVPLPLCSCAIIPTAVTLRKSGINNGPTSSFLVSTPETGLDSIMVTYAMMDLPMTIFRPIAAFLSGLIAGIIQFFYNDFTFVDTETKSEGCCSKTKKSSGETVLSLGGKVKEVFRFALIRLLQSL